MATISYPAVGEGGPNTEAAWAKMFNGPDGIVNDFDGTSAGVTFISASNVARVTPCIISVDGYFLEVTSNEDVPVPTAAGTYDLCAMYDPTLNVEGVGGAASALGPCRLVCVASPPSTTGGKAYTLLRRLVRATANAAPTTTIYGAHVGPNILVDGMPAAAKTDPETLIVGFRYPVGTVAFDLSNGEVYRKLINNDGGTYWRRGSMDGPYAFPANSPLQANAEAPFYYYTSNRAMVHLEGTLKRSSGAALTSTGSDVLLGTLPTEACPKKKVRCAVVAKPTSGWRTGQVEVRTNGEVYLLDTAGQGYDALWVDLSGVSFRVRS